MSGTRANDSGFNPLLMAAMVVVVTPPVEVICTVPPLTTQYSECGGRPLPSTVSSGFSRTSAWMTSGMFDSEP